MSKNPLSNRKAACIKWKGFRYGIIRKNGNAHNLKIQGIPHLVMKSAVDTREAAAVIHSRPIGEIPCEFIAKDDTIIYTPGNEDKIVPEWILVDEAQFLSAEQIDHDIIDSSTAYSMFSATILQVDSALASTAIVSIFTPYKIVKYYKII